MPNDNRNLLTTNIRLNINWKNPIQKTGDTICFSMRAYTNDSFNCHCYETKDGGVWISSICILRGSYKIVKTTYYDGIGMFPEKEEVQAILTNPKMIDFVKNNKAIVNPWFYNQLVKQGYLKE